MRFRQRSKCTANISGANYPNLHVAILVSAWAGQVEWSKAFVKKICFRLTSLVDSICAWTYQGS
ncbi:hypothetical protein PUN4_510006 [Paraburkholderia unamae]|nr:hypothetical protein PUN4_510006 [Paraburkholderia unamae]